MIPIALHPALIFTGTSLDLGRLSGASVAVTAPTPVLPIGQALAVEMGAEPIIIAEGDRAAYAEAVAAAQEFSRAVVRQGAEALREILKLYDFADSAETRRQIEGVLRVASRRVVGSIQDEGPIAFCRGVEVTIQFAEDRFPGGMLFLFASVLERFLALYCTINSFTKLIATVRGREGELRRWPPRIGERILA